MNKEIRDLLTEALGAWKEQFEGDPNESNCDISGADFLDWFAEWRQRAQDAFNRAQ